MGKNPEKTSVTMDDILPLCPVCGRELRSMNMKSKEGYLCKCGEFIPRSLVIDPLACCTHGRDCDCKRKIKR